MNDRIKLLAEQAYRLAYPITSLYEDGNLSKGNTEFEKKFAALIIKDITRGILPESKYFFAGEYSEDRIKTQQELSNAIEKYFGIEE